jgi:hypothetical protein
MGSEPKSSVMRSQNGSSTEVLRTPLYVLRIVAITVFSVVWGVQMYLSFRGPAVPSPISGAIYPVTIHGGVTYATRWQHYFATQEALGLAIGLIALNLLLRRLFASSQSF